MGSTVRVDVVLGVGSPIDENSWARSGRPTQSGHGSKEDNDGSMAWRQRTTTTVLKTRAPRPRSHMDTKRQRSRRAAAEATRTRGGATSLLRAIHRTPAVRQRTEQGGAVEDALLARPDAIARVRVHGTRRAAATRRRKRQGAAPRGAARGRERDSARVRQSFGTNRRVSFNP